MLDHLQGQPDFAVKPRCFPYPKPPLHRLCNMYSTFPDQRSMRTLQYMKAYCARHEELPAKVLHRTGAILSCSLYKSWLSRMHGLALDCRYHSERWCPANHNTLPGQRLAGGCQEVAAGDGQVSAVDQLELRLDAVLRSQLGAGLPVKLCGPAVAHVSLDPARQPSCVSDCFA